VMVGKANEIPVRAEGWQTVVTHVDNCRSGQRGSRDIHRHWESHGRIVAINSEHAGALFYGYETVPRLVFVWLGGRRACRHGT
jgi:hypothetical protein